MRVEILFKIKTQLPRERTARGVVIDIRQEIEERLAREFDLQHLEVVNESHQHNVPANSQTHFKLVLVSTQFTGVTRIKRHRQINALVPDLLAGEVHALALHPYTPQEWHKRFGAAPMSPPCLGGELGRAPGSDNTE